MTSQKIPKSVMERFLKGKKPKYKISLIETNSVLIAITVDLQDIGLESCEFCRHVDHRESVNIHRRTHHGI